MLLLSSYAIACIVYHAQLNSESRIKTSESQIKRITRITRMLVYDFGVSHVIFNMQ